MRQPCHSTQPIDTAPRRAKKPAKGRSMTDPIVRLETVQLSVDPGGQGRTLVTVRNLVTIVEGFRLQILGEGDSEWSEVTPPQVYVYPEQELIAVVVFSAPAGT